VPDESLPSQVPPDSGYVSTIGRYTPQSAE
jgi:hypothetical protein